VDVWFCGCIVVGILTGVCEYVCVYVCEGWSVVSIIENDPSVYVEFLWLHPDRGLNR